MSAGGRKIIETGGSWLPADGGQTLQIPKAGIYTLTAWVDVRTPGGGVDLILEIIQVPKGSVYKPPDNPYDPIYAWGSAANMPFITITASGMLRLNAGDRVGISLLSTQARTCTLKNYRFTATYLRQ